MGTRVMDLQDVYNEVVAVRKDLAEYRNESIAVKTDVAWLKRAVIGGFSFIFTLVGIGVAAAMANP
jgi:hypothetical protein